MAQNEKRPEVSSRARAFNLSALAFTLPVSIGVGAFIGYFLDGKLGTFPWLSLVFFSLGIAAGFLGLIRAVRAYDRQD